MSLLLASFTAPFASSSLLSHKCKANPTQFMKFATSPTIMASSISPIKCSKSVSINEVITDSDVHRSDFPDDFMFGASTSALQTEGAQERGACTWDMMLMGQNAIDSYHRYKDDVALLKNMSADCYRFSIAWSRILLSGRLSDGINQKGIDFYNNLINELIKNHIQPIVTLFHFDLPQNLEDDYGGFANRKIIDDFKDFAEICFKNFGDRVKYWTTFNEPQVISESLYKDHYIVTHNIILAHATIARLYRENFQDLQGGEIGFPLAVQWYVPYTNEPYDIDAAKRGFDFLVGADGANVGGYCVWCLLDCMELASGYDVRMGLNYTDYLNNLDRIPKASAKWFKNFLAFKS